MHPLTMIVPLKPVPAPRSWDKIRLDPQSKTLRRDEVPSIINPLDKHALEEALRIKEARGGHVAVVTMAPLQAEETLTEALAMGADEAFLLSDPLFAGADTLATAYVLSAGIRKLGSPDLVLCGAQSLDGSTGQVGPQVAEFLDIPQLTSVSRVELVGEKTIRATCATEDGHRVLETGLPVLLTVTREINRPRYISLQGILDAEEKRLERWSARDIAVDENKVGLQGSPTQMADIFMPEVKRRGEILEGKVEDIVERLMDKLYELDAI